MGAKHALRGYYVQNLMLIIDMLGGQPSWSKVEIEPEEGGEKTDYRFMKDNTIIQAIQVKSTKNTFGKGDISKAIEGLKLCKAESYKLILVGKLPNSMPDFDDVEIEHQPLNTDSLLNDAFKRITMRIEMLGHPAIGGTQTTNLLDSISSGVWLRSFSEVSEITPQDLNKRINNFLEVSSSSDQVQSELSDRQAFKELFGFVGYRSLRNAISTFYFLHEDKIHSSELKAVKAHLSEDLGQLKLNFNKIHSFEIGYYIACFVVVGFFMIALAWAIDDVYQCKSVPQFIASGFVLAVFLQYILRPALIYRKIKTLLRPSAQANS